MSAVIVHLNSHSTMPVLVYPGADFYSVPNGDHLNVYRALAEGQSTVMRTPIATIRDWSAVSIVDDEVGKAISRAQCVDCTQRERARLRDGLAEARAKTDAREAARESDLKNHAQLQAEYFRG